MARYNKEEIKADLTERFGIDFTDDFHVLRSSQVSELVAKAKALGYRHNAKTASGSLGRSFFYHLNRK